MVRPPQQIVQPEDLEVVVNGNGAAVGAPIEKIMELEQPSAQVLHQLHRAVRQYLERYQYSMNKLDELKAELDRWMMSDDLDPTVPFEDSDAPENNGDSQQLNEISDKVRLILDDTLCNSTGEVGRYLTVCGSVIVNIQRGCIEVVVEFKSNSKLAAFLESLLGRTIHSVVWESIKEQVDAKLEEVFAESPIGLAMVRHIMGYHDLKIVCGLAEIATNSFPAVVVVRFEILQAATNFKQDFYTPVLPEEWINNRSSGEVRRILKAYLCKVDVQASEPLSITDTSDDQVDRPVRFMPSAFGSDSTAVVIKTYLVERLSDLKTRSASEGMGAADLQFVEDINSNLTARELEETTTVGKALAQIGDEISMQYSAQFQAMSTSFWKSAGANLQKIVKQFGNIAMTLFSKGEVSWGQIIALLELGFYLIKDRVQIPGIDVLFTAIIQSIKGFMLIYKFAETARTVYDWIAEHGGWLKAVDYVKSVTKHFGFKEWTLTAIPVVATFATAAMVLYSRYLRNTN